MLYANYYLESNGSIHKQLKDHVLNYLGRQLSNEMQEETCIRLTASLKAGYADQNRSQQALKAKYIELLTQTCTIFHMIIDMVVNYLDNKQNLYELMCQSASEARNNGFTDSEIMQTIKSALSSDSAFLKTAEATIPSIFIKKGYSKHQAEYLKTMLIAWLERGQKLIKNDIFDMLCVGALDKVASSHSTNMLIDQSSYLISFDDTMMKFLCNNAGNVRLLNKFLLTQYQLNP